MRVILLVLAVAGCGRVSFGYPVVPCDEVVGTKTTLDPDTEHCYARFAGPSSLSQSATACYSLGGHLATITSPEEQATILGLGLGGGARIGLTNGSPGNTDFVWIISDPLTFTSWAAGQPVLCAGSTTAVAMDASGAWTAGCHGDGMPFVCEIEPWLVRDNGHAYRVSWANQSWPIAAASCEAMGAHLATLTSADELAFVAPLVTTELWLGGTSSPAGGSWITGESFGFTAWRSAAPNATGDECILMLAGQQWEDVSCTTYAAAALCERDE